MRGVAAVAALVTLALAVPAWADMYQDASNAKLPEAMVKLLSQGATIAGVVDVTTPEDKLTPFVPPGFGGTWRAGQFFRTTTGEHNGDARAAMNVDHKAEGSTAFGPASSDIGLYVTASKNNWLTSNIEGELAGQWIVTQQGRRGDTGALITSSSKVRSNTADDTGAITSMEIEGNWQDTSGNRLWNIHTLPSFGTGVGPTDVSGGGGYGIMLANMWAGTAPTGDMIMPYSGVMVENYGMNWACTPPLCSEWKHAFTAAADSSSDAGSIYFQVDAGPTASGDIKMGSGWVTLPGGVASQSGSFQIIQKNVNGAWELTNKSGTVAKTIQTSNNGVGGVYERLAGPFLENQWRDTNTAVTAGGLQRLAFSGGSALWQINTASAGDFSTSLLAWHIFPSGGVDVSAGGFDPGFGQLNAGGYNVSGVSGVSCAAGVPTASFKVDGGIITHC